MKLNTTKIIHTHEGGKAFQTNTYQQLRRSVASCLLWEDEAYEDGQKIADRIESLARHVPADQVNQLAIEARHVFKLRHVSLLLLTIYPNAETIYQTISRADELSELLAIYWRNGKRPIPSQMKKGLSRAFTKFDEYALAKYNRDGRIKLRDVLFLVHAKPKTREQEQLWKRLVEGKLFTPDTWEVSLSGGADKKETFERLILEGKLGYLALLRNLRNMVEANVDSGILSKAILARKGAENVLPFRYIAAARYAPQYEPFIDQALQESIKDLPILTGKTVVLVDVSGSMGQQLSSKSDMTRMDSACALGVIVQSEMKVVYTFSNRVELVPTRSGMSGVDAIKYSQNHNGTYLSKALKEINTRVPDYDRIIVITDEQTRDGISEPLEGSKAYLINVASSQNGVGYGRWIHIDGFSENVIRYIVEIEK